MAAPDEKRALRALVHGRVQGVGFRWSAVREARSLGLSGLVANRPDGTVEVIAEGDPARLARLVNWLEKGPTGGPRLQRRRGVAALVGRLQRVRRGLLATVSDTLR